jgi:hypothetical protein
VKKKMKKIKTFSLCDNVRNIAIHRYTRVENPGGRVAQVFPQIPEGEVKAIRKIAGGGPPIFGFITFL